MNLGPNGPQIVTHIAITVITAVVVLVMSSSFWNSEDAEGPLRFIPFMILGIVVLRIVQAVRSGRQQIDKVWTHSIEEQPPPLQRTTKARPSWEMNEFWDAAIGDQLRTVSNRLDLGPNGPRVIGQLVVMLAIVAFVLVFLALIGGGPSGWFVLVFLSPLGLVIVRTLRSARADLTSGWREGPTDDQL